MADATWPCSPANIFSRPSADQIWLGPTQRSVLGQLAEAPESAVRLLVGPRSCGKSTLLEHWTAQFDSAIVLRSRGTELGSTSLLSGLLRSAGFAPWGLSETDLRNLLTLFLRQRFIQGRKVVVTLERADRLGTDAMRELDRIAGILVDGEPALEIYLCGQPVLLERIRGRDAGWLSTRWYASTVAAVSPADTADYICWRLSRYGLPEQLFTAAATELVAHLSEGRFSSINLLAQMALALARTAGAKAVDVMLVTRAADELKRRAGERREAGRALPRRATQVPGYLLVTRDGQTVARAPLAPKLVFGSGEDCDVYLPGEPPRRCHGVIVETPDGFDVIELPGGRSLALNGRPVTRARLVDHDRIEVGPYVLHFFAPRDAGPIEAIPRPEAQSYIPPLRVVK